MAYTRDHPSARYRALLEQYRRMHEEGERFLGVSAQDTFPGKSLLPHLVPIRRLIEATGAKTVLDYGAGKGRQYRPRPVVVEGVRVADSVAEYWDVDEVRCYDPGYAPYARLPTERFDGVVCTDVLEHCPEEDLAWMLDEILGFAERFVFLNVACFPARKRLPSGENTHVTLRPPAWWRDLVRGRPAAQSGLLWQLRAAYREGERTLETVYRSDRADEEWPPAADVTSVDIDGRPARFYTPNEKTRWRAATLYTKEPVTIEWLRAMPKGAVFVDVGANVGVYTVYAAVAREARVYAFEPEAQNFALLNRNIGANGLGRLVVAFCAALADVRTVDRLYLAEGTAGSSCHSFGSEVGFDLEPRPAAHVQGCLSLRLDDLVSEGVVPVPRYVKIDVDGFEHKVVAGARRTLERPEVRELLVEINHNLEQHLDLIGELNRLGFRHDPAQVARAERREGPFKGVAEYVFNR